MNFPSFFIHRYWHIFFKLLLCSIFFTSSFSLAHGATSWDFSTPSDYTYDTQKIQLSSGKAEVRQLDQVDDDNASQGFGGATHFQTVFNTLLSTVELATGEQVGTMLGRILPVGTSVSWDTFSWVPRAPYGKSLPKNGATETAYGEKNVSMTDNTLLLQGHDSFADSSGNHSNLSCVGDQCPTSTAGHSGNALLFDGSNDCVYREDDGANDVSGPFSISAWFNTSSINNTYNKIIFTRTNAAGQDVSAPYFLVLLSDNRLLFTVTNNSAGDYLFSTGFTPTVGAWHHVVVVATGTELQLYIDGVLNSTTTQNVQAFNGQDPFQVGCARNQINSFNGKLDELAMFNKALSPAEVSQVMAGTYPSKSVMVQYTFDETQVHDFYRDVSPLGQTVTCTAPTCPTITDGIAGKGLRFDGISNVLDVPDGTGTDVSVPFSLGVWVRPTQLGDTFTKIFLWKGNTAGANSSSPFYFGKLSNDHFYFNIHDGSSSDQIISNGIASVGNWYHVVATVDATDVKLYINGALDTSIPRTVTPQNSSFPLQIGGIDTLSTNTIHATMDEIAMFSRALSASDVLAMYERGANQLKFQVRSCTQADCSGSSFTGPGGSPYSYFSESNLEADSLPSFSLHNIFDGAFFQYKAYLSSFASTHTPKLSSVTIAPTHYYHAPTITNQTGTAFTTLQNFSEVFGAGNLGTVEYQISYDGTHWYFWNGTAWILETGQGYPMQTSTSTDISNNIAQFPTAVGTGLFYFKGFLISQGIHSVSLDSVSLDSSNLPPFGNMGVGVGLDPNTASATQTTYTITVTPSLLIPNGGKIQLLFPGQYSGALASLTAGDIHVSGAQVQGVTQEVDALRGTITLTLASAAGITSPVVVTIGDGVGPENDLVNPSLNGIYGVHVSTYGDTNALIESTLYTVPIGNGVSVKALVTDALILSLPDTQVQFQADPSMGGGQDRNQHTSIVVSSNARNGYLLYGKLDDGLGEARLSSGVHHIPAGVGENTFGYEATNTTYDANRTVEADTYFSNIPTALLSHGINIGASVPTNEQEHTVYYHLSVDYLTTAGTYGGTMTYTVVGSF